MKIAIVTTGDEIMSGNVVDTNSAYIADQCWKLGLMVAWHGGVPDDKKAIGDACRLASERADVVFVSGGLGATLDDITVESAAAEFGKKMILHESVWKDIQDFFKARGRECSENNKRQAYLPEGGKPLLNRVGTAPGVQVKLGNAMFFFLPGVPKELFQIFEDSILPWLKEQTKESSYHEKFLKCFGLPEASLDQRISDLKFEDVRLSFRVTFPEIKIKLVSRSKNAKEKVAAAESEIRKRIGEYIFGSGSDTLESVVGKMLQKRSLKLAVAESCTGGLLSNLITNVSGSSEWFERGIVTYSNESKIEILGVLPETIKKYGAVSKECAEEMAKGLLKVSRADIGIAITGIAGPTGGTEQKPVGTVHISLAAKDKLLHNKFTNPREREHFKLWTAYQAMDILRRYLI